MSPVACPDVTRRVAGLSLESEGAHPLANDDRMGGGQSPLRDAFEWRVPKGPGFLNAKKVARYTSLQSKANVNIVMFRSKTPPGPQLQQRPRTRATDALPRKFKPKHFITPFLCVSSRPNARPGFFLRFVEAKTHFCARRCSKKGPSGPAALFLK